MDTTQEKNNEQFTISGNWDIQSKQLKTSYAQLTDEDLKFEPGKEHDLVARIQSRLSKPREEVIGIIKKAESANV